MQSTFVRSYADPTILPKEGLNQVAFFSRSNAGKSSLINSLTNKKDLAHTSAKPGRTKLINIFDVAGQFHLVDLPGYGFAKGSKEDRDQLFALIDGYVRTSELLCLAIVIIDCRIGPTEDDLQLIGLLQDLRIPFFIVANKIDKLSRTELEKALAQLRAQFEGITIFPHSAVTSAGRGELYDAIVRAVKSDTI
ncbi:MAG: ribosome biogenesis GTP-binding protein YihA/YsxC [Patescibacteria group bacterium]